MSIGLVDLACLSWSASHICCLLNSSWLCFIKALCSCLRTALTESPRYLATWNLSNVILSMAPGIFARVDLIYAGHMSMRCYKSRPSALHSGCCNSYPDSLSCAHQHQYVLEGASLRRAIPLMTALCIMPLTAFQININ